MMNSKLRVFDGDDAAPPPRILPLTARDRNRKKPKRGPTLRAVYERHVKPQLLAKSRAESTIRDIERALERWEEYWRSSPVSLASGPREERTQDPFPSQATEQTAETARPSVPVQLRVRGVKRRHLEEFQIHLQTATSRRGKPFAKSTINGDLGQSDKFSALQKHTDCSRAAGHVWHGSTPSQRSNSTYRETR